MTSGCKVDGCTDPIKASELCERHYAQFKRHGRTLKRSKGDPNRIKEKERYAVVYLCNRKREVVAKARIDLRDVERVRKHKWYLSGRYVRSVKGGLLHRYIMRAKPDEQYDHKNNNPMDCRRKNLRLSTQPENTRNRKRNKNNTSGAKGVHWSKHQGAYIAYINVDKKRRNLGTFVELVDAAKAYNAAAVKYHGEFAKLNDITNLTAEAE